VRRILDSENEEAEFVIVGVNGEGNDGVWTIIAIEEMEAVVEEKGIGIVLTGRRRKQWRGE